MTDPYDNPACHTEVDYEDIPPQPPTPESMGDMARVAALRDLLDEYGYPYVEEPGWETRQETYHWYSGGPFGVMIHHTGVVPYSNKSCYPKPDGNRTDGRVICNALVRVDGTIHLVAAGPANYSSGLNQKALLDDYVLPGIRFHGPQSGPLGPEWYGNRAWLNIEVENRGDGGPIPAAQENAVIALTTMICYLFDWDATAVVGHYDGRGTKVDPRWDGEYATPPYSIAKIQDRVQQILDTGQAPPIPGEPMFTHYELGHTYREFEQIVWLLVLAKGGSIDPNPPALPQIQATLPYKSAVTLVEPGDFQTLGEIIGMTQAKIDQMMGTGLNRSGKEVAALTNEAYGN